MKRISVEIQLTFRCKFACVNCNRLVNLYPDRTDDIPVERLQQLGEELNDHRKDVYIKRLKVVGGDPVCHPDIATILTLLQDWLATELIGKLKVQTMLPHKHLPQAGIHWMGPERRKCHLPVLWSPRDLGYKSDKPGCSMLTRCGFSLDNRGWLPCSAAIAIVRTFGLEHLYRQEIPTEPWGLDELCPDCVFWMPDEWKRHHGFSPLDTPEDHKQPTATWAERMNIYDRR